MNRYVQGPHAGSAGGDLTFLSRSSGGGSAMENLIDVEFGAGPSSATEARNALMALRCRVDEDVLNDVRLLVSELVTNSVRHSNIRHADPVRMRVLASASTVRVEVCDPGDGFEPRPRDADRTRPGGWGLYLVDELADRWGVSRDDGTRVWFEIDAGRERRRLADEYAA